MEGGRPGLPLRIPFVEAGVSSTRLEHRVRETLPRVASIQKLPRPSGAIPSTRCLSEFMSPKLAILLIVLFPLTGCAILKRGVTTYARTDFPKLHRGMSRAEVQRAVPEVLRIEIGTGLAPMRSENWYFKDGSHALFWFSHEAKSLEELGAYWKTGHLDPKDTFLSFGPPESLQITRYE
jgi:hypothetical protein